MQERAGFRFGFKLQTKKIKSHSLPILEKSQCEVKQAQSRPGFLSTRLKIALQMIVATHSSLGREEALLRKLTYS